MTDYTFHPHRPIIYIWKVRIILAEAHSYDFRKLEESMPENFSEGQEVSYGIEKNLIYADIQLSININDEPRPDYTMINVIGEVTAKFHEAAVNSFIPD